MKNNTQTMIKKTYKIHSLEVAAYTLVEKLLPKITFEEIP